MKRARMVYKTRWLESVPSKGTFDRGSVVSVLLTKGHSICSPEGTKQENSALRGTISELVDVLRATRFGGQPSPDLLA